MVTYRTSSFRNQQLVLNVIEENLKRVYWSNILKVNYNNRNHILCIPLVKLVDIRSKFYENPNFKVNIPEHQITKWIYMPMNILFPSSPLYKSKTSQHKTYIHKCLNRHRDNHMQRPYLYTWAMIHTALVMVFILKDSFHERPYGHTSLSEHIKYE